MLYGENINVTVLKYDAENTCNPDSTEITNNCFTDITVLCAGEEAEVLFTNLIPMTPYLLAVWTDENEQTDFEFCLTSAPAYECGDGICYYLAENIYSCPEDCSAPFEDECINSLDIGFRGRPDCNCTVSSTTSNATFNGATDLFSCDESLSKSTVFYRFSPRVDNIEFNLLEGENINVALLKYKENECNPDSLELTEFCFTNLNAIVDYEDAPEALFSNLKPPDYFPEYILAIWTDETEQTDFKFCLRESVIECGDSICNDLVENPNNCPQDCIGTAVDDHFTTFQIYPNPVIDKIHIITNSNIKKNATVSIHSIDGKVIHQEKLISHSSNYQLNVNHLPEGMYCLQVYTGQINHLHKFLKME